MTDTRTTTLQDVFEYLRDVTRQSQLMIQEAAEALRKEMKCYFQHQRAWDYVDRPNEHFLDAHHLGVTRAWVTYVPEGNLSRAALFYFQFTHGEHLVVPALMYGSLDPGTDRNFDAINRWAPYNTIVDVEEGADDFKVENDEPFAIVTSTRENHFTDSRLVRVPLESITSTEDLQCIIVHPLAALIRGEVEEAGKLLKGVQTMHWPTRDHRDEDDDDELERV